MSLQERLEKIAAQSAEQIPLDAQRVMKREIEAVADSLPDRNIPGPGSPFPPFELPNSQGDLVRSREWVKRGPLVVTFFRGKW